MLYMCMSITQNRNGGLTGSGRGQKPFIEYNGEQVADSTNIIDFLTTKYNKGTVEAALPAVERATAHAMDQMVEHNVFWWENRRIKLISS